MEGSPPDLHGWDVSAGVTNFVDAPLYRLDTMRVKSLESPKNSSIRTSCLWSVEENAPLKSMYQKTMPFSWEWASYTQRLRWVTALAHERSALKPLVRDLTYLRVSTSTVARVTMHVVHTL